MIDQAIEAFLMEDVLARFVRYARVYTTSLETSTTRPTTARQLDLLRLLEGECRTLGLVDIALDPKGYLYATLPARASAGGIPFALLAHVDTSPEQPGDGVEPVLHADWDGSPIRFPKDPALVLSIEDCPALASFVRDVVVTAAGDTLLGADDKAGVAEIMAAVAALVRFPSLPHGEIRLVFTTDEEVGRGVLDIDLERLPLHCYTVDGGLPGELEAECFDAWGVALTFTGVGVHPGSAKDRLVNASTAAARFVAAIPRDESPERTEHRAGFYYVYDVAAGCEKATVKLIVRDFEPAENARRLAHLATLARAVERDTPGLRVELETRHQYPNMREVVERHPQVMELARAAYRDAGLVPIEKPIRGGTDGSLLSQRGRPTPNLFTGGQLGHSRREWVARGAMVAASKMLIHLARRHGEA